MRQDLQNSLRLPTADVILDMEVLFSVLSVFCSLTIWSKRPRLGFLGYASRPTQRFTCYNIGLCALTRPHCVTITEQKCYSIYCFLSSELFNVAPAWILT